MSTITPIRAGVAAWLGVLFCLVFTLNTVGGWVRLSGSGVAIPHWPVIERGNTWTLLPPFTSEGWADMQAAFELHQARLQARIERGELTAANRGRQPRDANDFRTMFLTEWSHRLLAALTGLVAAAVIISTLRHAPLRRIAGTPLVLAGVLIIAQAVLGGLLVAEGTSTHWLFLHQGNAGLIMSLIMWAILRLLVPEENDATAVAADPRRRWVRRITAGVMIGVWLQLLFGALVAGSRHLLPGHPPLGLGVLPQLWSADHGLSWNLLDNAWLHLWLHRWWAWLLCVVCVGLYALAWHSPTGIRQRLALQVSGTFLALQVIFGLANAMLGSTPLIALAHQALGMCLLLSLVLAWHDAGCEPLAEPDQDSSSSSSSAVSQLGIHT
jgi:cytochrome c oxidase assembly protein subunit 15